MLIIASKADLARSAAACMVNPYATLKRQHGSSSTALKALAPLFDVIADLPEGIAVVPVFAADKHEALKAAKKMFPGDMNNYFSRRLMGCQLFTS